MKKVIRRFFLFVTVILVTCMSTFPAYAAGNTNKSFLSKYSSYGSFTDKLNFNKTPSVPTQNASSSESSNGSSNAFPNASSTSEKILCENTADDASDAVAKEDTADNTAAEKIFEEDSRVKIDIPILMYHHIDRETKNGMTITPEAFEAQISAIAEAGFTAITFADLENYVKNGAKLPEKPFIITFDDGYRSNFEFAYPILKKYNMCATIFVIGSSVGKSVYKDTDNPIFPHFSEEEAMEMAESGLIDIQSHTYDMHQTVLYEEGEAREVMTKLSYESDDDFLAAVRNDTAKNIELIEAMTGEKVFVHAFPGGHVDPSAQSVLLEEGITITLSTEYGVQQVIRGNTSSLLSMMRLSVNEESDPTALIGIMEMHLDVDGR